MKEISCKWFVEGSEENIFYNNFRYSQGDNIIPNIELLTDFDLESYSVNAFFCLPNGTIILQNDIEISGNMVSFKILEEALVLQGIHKIEITLNGTGDEQLTLPNGIKYEVVEVKSFESDVVLPTEQNETVAELANTLTVAITTGGTISEELTQAIALADLRIENLTSLLDGESSGHVIEDSDGVTLPHRSVLKISGATIFDDSANDTTLVTVTSATYRHNQISAQSTWTIQHNLSKYPSVTVVDSSGEVVGGDVLYLDNNSVQVKFSGAFSGKAYLN